MFAPQQQRALQQDLAGTFPQVFATSEMLGNMHRARQRIQWRDTCFVCHTKNMSLHKRFHASSFSTCNFFNGNVKNHPLMSESWIFLSTFRNACISDERVACCTPLQKLVVHKERCSVLVPKKLQLLWA